MTKEEAVKEIEKAFEPAFANYIITALTEGATVSDKEPTTKNDLGVDWESYKDIDGNSLDDLILEVLQNNFDCGNTYGYKVADEIIGLLPSVTPQEPRKAHWVTRPHVFGIAYCSECDFELKIDNTNFCPNCGADMRDVQE